MQPTDQTSTIIMKFPLNDKKNNLNYRILAMLVIIQELCTILWPHSLYTLGISYILNLKQSNELNQNHKFLNHNYCSQVNLRVS